MRRFTFLAACCAAIALSSCTTRTDDTATSDTAAGSVATGDLAATGVLSPSAVAGRWNMLATPEAGGADSMITQYVLNATDDPKNWTISYPGRRPVPVDVTFSGDSIMTRAGPYPSFRRSGVRVRTEGVVRLEGDRLVGHTIARYNTGRPDSVLRLRTEGTRAP